jgi:hypothetical protein
VRQDIEPNRTLEAATKAALRRQYAWKCERPSNCDERRQRAKAKRMASCGDCRPTTSCTTS